MFLKYAHRFFDLFIAYTKSGCLIEAPVERLRSFREDGLFEGKPKACNHKGQSGSPYNSQDIHATKKTVKHKSAYSRIGKILNHDTYSETAQHKEPSNDYHDHSHYLEKVNRAFPCCEFFLLATIIG